MIILHKKSQDYFYLLLVIASTTTLALYLYSTSQVFNVNDINNNNNNIVNGRGIIRAETYVLSSFQQQQQQQQQKHQTSSHEVTTATTTTTTTTNNNNNNNNTKKCAVLLFGLPRAFRTIVLPSLVQNVLRPTVAQYNCDIYVHYYQVDHEKPGRGHQGGKIEKDAVLLLRQAVADLILATATATTATTTTTTAPAVHIISETEEQFWLQRNTTVQKYRTTLNTDDNKYLYFPWKDRGYLYPLSLDNIVKQWHSINAVFGKMEATCRQCYERIAMLRLDVFYATPIDIYQLNSQTKDTLNQYAVLPAFGKHPVNDRMIYGPYQAVKIWATERFQRIEEHVRTYEPGYGMHSERFLNHSILPAIEQEAGVRIRENPDICFMRVRADESIWTWDCNFSSNRIRGGTRGMGKVNKKELIESILQRNCTEKTLSTGVKPVICSE